MAKHRLINCDFLNASAFKKYTSNKAKLLYLMMINCADDMGFVDNVSELITILEDNDKEFLNQTNLQLLGNDYQTALEELIEKGFLLEFKDNHSNRVYLVRHWFYHNKLKKGLWTNYRKYREMVEIIDNEYHLKKSNTKENNKLNQDKLNQDKLNQINPNYSEEQNEEEQGETNGDELNENDYPWR